MCEVILDLLMGLLLCNHWRVSVTVMVSAFGLLFVLEGLLLLYMAVRSPTATSHKLLTCCGAVTSAIGLMILLRLVNDPLRWAGVFVGIKLLTFGGTLTWIALRGAADGLLRLSTNRPRFTPSPAKPTRSISARRFIWGFSSATARWSTISK